MQSNIEPATRLDVAYDQALTASVQLPSGVLTDDEKQRLGNALDTLRDISKRLLADSQTHSRKV